MALFVIGFEALRKWYSLSGGTIYDYSIQVGSPFVFWSSRSHWAREQFYPGFLLADFIVLILVGLLGGFAAWYISLRFSLKSFLHYLAAGWCLIMGTAVLIHLYWLSRRLFRQWQSGADRWTFAIGWPEGFYWRLDQASVMYYQDLATDLKVWTLFAGALTLLAYAASGLIRPRARREPEP
ncbi:MAG TPA: hypothetical protein VLV83_16385 [Acidobacteriota bacterium]|nr:hypothetical protein [Acidobacteriota bacterium]